MAFSPILVSSVSELGKLLTPVLEGRVSQLAVDTETTEVVNGYYTPLGTDLRMAGYSLSWGGYAGLEAVDLYVPVAHVPYDWRRRRELIEGDSANAGAKWVTRLLEVEGVAPPTVAGSGAWAGANPNVDRDGSLGYLVDALAAVEWVYAHNATFDAKVLLREGVAVPWERLECSQAMSVLTDTRPLDKWDSDAQEYIHGGHALKHLGEVWLGMPRDAQAELEQAKRALGVGGAMLNDYSMLPLRTAIAPYAAMDTRLTLDLVRHIECRDAYLDRRIKALLDMHRAERRLVVDMETRGMPVDTELSATRAVECKARIDESLRAMKAHAGGRAVPVDSPTKLAPFLYGELGIPRYRGEDNTREATLKQVRTDVVLHARTHCGVLPADDAIKLLDDIAEYRRYSKEYSSFFEPLSRGTGVIHPIIRPLGARTTRMACEKPNAQQVKKPRKGEDAEQSVRHLFKPPPDSGFLCLDYSAQEMRVAAHYTDAIPASFAYRFTWRCTMPKRGSCKGRGAHGPGEIHVGYRDNYSTRPEVLHLLQGFITQGTSFDPHTRMIDYVAAEGLDLDREQCKTGNYAILYGAGGPKLATTLGCSVSTAYRLIRAFWDTIYPELGRVKLFIDERLRRIGPETKWSHQDYVTTLHGGRVYLEDGYKGLNYLVQRSCREIMGRALVSVDEYLRAEGLEEVYQLRLPVHDEVILLVPTSELRQEVVREIARRMVYAGRASRCPMVVEPKWAERSWAFKEALGEGWGYDGVTDGIEAGEVK